MMANVQVGTRSAKGTTFTTKLGRNAKCHPTSMVSSAQTTTSNASSMGEMKPSEKSGNKTICKRSAPTAMMRASQIRVGLILFTVRARVAVPNSKVLCPAVDVNGCVRVGLQVFVGAVPERTRSSTKHSDCVLHTILGPILNAQGDYCATAR